MAIPAIQRTTTLRNKKSIETDPIDLTFFLALAAGLEYQPARTIALASQYVDDNPMTRPLDDSTLPSTVLSIFKNHEQLKSYHFVLSDDDGKTLVAYDNNNVNWVLDNAQGLSPQLQNLLGASKNAPTACAKYQFLGEFMHAFSDTFSHRDQTNKPIDPLMLGQGVGHGLMGSEPDFTFNKSSNGWTVREDRTLAAGKSMFYILKGYGNGSGVQWSDIEATVIAFNKTEENEKTGIDTKKTILQDALNKMLADIDIYPTDLPKGAETINFFDEGEDSKYAYNRGEAESNRNEYLGGLSETDYPGTCLPGGTRCKPF